LFYFFNFFKKIIDSYFLFNCKIILSIERQFCYKNAQSAFILVSFYSVFLLLAEIFQLHCVSFMPTEVKKIITGNGRATKEELFLFAQRYLSCSLLVSSYDESDAILISLAAALELQ
jgi:crossover junction endodeoxyribonuclease RuvC